MRPSKPAYLFLATQGVANRLGELSSFLWANYIGLRDLCWQVRGFRAAFPELGANELKNKFVGPLPLPGGVDLIRVCVDRSWADHEQEFSQWMLFQTCTLYEAWAEKVCSDLFGGNRAKDLAKDLQFPGHITAKGTRKGYLAAVQEANAAKSAVMVRDFFPTLRQGKLNRWSTVNEHLMAYRYFKECRNAFIHSDGCATTEVIDSYSKLAAIQTNRSDVFEHPFKLPAPFLEKRVTLNLRDCVLLSTVVHRLICTFDAALSVCVQSEKLVESRLRAVISKDSKWKHLPSDPVKRTQRLHGLLAKARIPEPQDFNNVASWMKNEGLIR
jgi:hypothetical protein